MKITLVASAVGLLLSSSLFAQQSTGTIAGRVLDPQGRAIAGATVTARNPDTGFVRTETSDNAGMYRLAALPVASRALVTMLAHLGAVTHPGHAGERKVYADI